MRLGRPDGAELLEKYRFGLAPARCALQRLESVRQSWRQALTNLKKTYGNLLDLIFPELGHSWKSMGLVSALFCSRHPRPKQSPDSVSPLCKGLEAAA